MSFDLKAKIVLRQNNPKEPWRWVVKSPDRSYSIEGYGATREEAEASARAAWAKDRANAEYVRSHTVEIDLD